jgi:hypothetical protein
VPSLVIFWTTKSIYGFKKEPIWCGRDLRVNEYGGLEPDQELTQRQLGPKPGTHIFAAA